MIDLTRNEQVLQKNIDRAKERNIILPTFAQMRDPEQIPGKIREKLKDVGLWDINPLNLFRITWHNEPKEKGGQFGKPNFLVLPKELTGVDAKIVCLVGKWFPTGCHKVGASIGCLLPRLVTGQFDSTYHKAVWPSTGNYCRGGAFDSKLLSCYSIAILPAEMSKERFDWLSTVASETIATPGCESNVKEIFDKTWELRNTREDVMIFNQFEEMGNHLWHYNITGPAIEEAYNLIKTDKSNFAGACFTSGSAGTTAAGDYLKTVFPNAKCATGEALQCPTLLNNGFGGHRIEGIGDKHVPWIHNVKNTDAVIDIDDADPMALLRLFNEPEGKKWLIEELSLEPEYAESLSLLGISGIANLLCCIKMAKYYEFTENDIVATVLTDSAAMYQSRIAGMKEAEGIYSTARAAVDYALHLEGQKTDHMKELTCEERKRIHNLKYYTWVEQQGKTSAELNALWYGGEFEKVHAQAGAIDELISAFNDAAAV